MPSSVSSPCFSTVWICTSFLTMLPTQWGFILLVAHRIAQYLNCTVGDTTREPEFISRINLVLFFLFVQLPRNWDQSLLVLLSEDGILTCTNRSVLCALCDFNSYTWYNYRWYQTRSSIMQKLVSLKEILGLMVDGVVQIKLEGWSKMCLVLC